MSLALCDKLNNTISELTAVSDFIKRIGDENHLIEEETPLGLHLILDGCITELKSVSAAI